VTAIVLLPLLLGEGLPDSRSSVKVFFSEPLAVQPPPPPPPPAPAQAAARARAQPAPISPTAFTAPVEVPTEIRPEAGLDMGLEGGFPGGVEGGVPGGVVGGLPDAPPVPALKAVRVGGSIKEPKKVRHVVPLYPDVALKARLEGLVIIEATLDERGRVTDARVLRGVPLLDEAALEAVRQWVYSPTLLDGVPTPVVMTVTVSFRVKSAMS
jgi:protein TonB